MEPVYESLIRNKAYSAEIEPMLAERWEGSADNMSWTFYLRKGIQFHEGWGEFTAEDVKFTYEKTIAEASKNGSASTMRTLIKSVEVIDPYTVRINMASPIIDMPQRQSLTLTYHGLNIISKKYHEAVGDMKAAQKPIGTGPYRFVEYKPGDAVTLEAVEGHWRITPYYKTLIFKLVPDPGTELAKLKAGEVDLIGIGIDNIPEIEGKRGLKVIQTAPINMYSLYFAGLYAQGQGSYPTLPWVGPDPEKALKVRKAMNLAINRQEILDHVFKGRGQSMTEFQFFPDYPTTDRSVIGYPYDPDQARKLLAEAGFPNGFEFDLVYTSTTSMPQMGDLTLLAASYWEKIGLKPKVQSMELGPLYSGYSRRTLGKFIYAFPSGWYGDTVQPYASVVSGPGARHLEHPNMDPLIKAVQLETDPAKLAEKLRALQRFVHDNYLTITVAAVPKIWAVSDKVGSWPMRGSGILADLEYITP